MPLSQATRASWQPAAVTTSKLGQYPSKFSLMRTEASKDVEGLPALESANSGFIVHITPVEELDDVRLENTRGGSYLNATQSTTTGNRCTTGFTMHDVTNSNRRGVSTAGHCASDTPQRWYRNHNSSSWSAHVRQEWHVGQYGDIGWYGSNNSLPQFYASWGGVRNVTGSARPVVGQRLWFFGTGNASTGQQTATVAANGNCASNRCNLTAMDSNVTVPGDSGGPWFSGNTAYRVHCCTVGSLSNFTPVYVFSNLWGMVVTRA